MSNENEFKTPEERLEKFKDMNEGTDNETNRTANNNTQSGDHTNHQHPIEGDSQQLRETLGGATNLSLEQLKEGESQAGGNDE